jgi:hypothetical protein
MGKNLEKEQISSNHFGAWRLIPPASCFRKKAAGGILLNQFMIAVLMVALMCGCGYSNKSLISRNISSIHIPIFENNTFRRGIEFDLTKAVKNEVMSKTNLRIVGKDYADVILHGTVKEFTERTITQGFRDSLVEGQMTLFVDIELVDKRTGRTLINEKGIKQAAEYIVRRGETLDSATEEGIVNLAEIIVDHLAEKW